MGVYKRRGRWWIDYYIQGGQRVREPVKIQGVDSSQITQDMASEVVVLKKAEEADGVVMPEARRRAQIRTRARLSELIEVAKLEQTGRKHVAQNINKQEVFIMSNDSTNGQSCWQAPSGGQCENVSPVGIRGDGREDSGSENRILTVLNSILSEIRAIRESIPKDSVRDLSEEPVRRQSQAQPAKLESKFTTDTDTESKWNAFAEDICRTGVPKYVRDLSQANQFLYYTVFSPRARYPRGMFYTSRNCPEGIEIGLRDKKENPPTPEPRRVKRRVSLKALAQALKCGELIEFDTKAEADSFRRQLNKLGYGATQRSEGDKVVVWKLVRR